MKSLASGKARRCTATFPHPPSVLVLSRSRADTRPSHSLPRQLSRYLRLATPPARLRRVHKRSL